VAGVTVARSTLARLPGLDERRGIIMFGVNDRSNMLQSPPTFIHRSMPNTLVIAIQHVRLTILPRLLTHLLSNKPPFHVPETIKTIQDLNEARDDGWSSM